MLTGLASLLRILVAALVAMAVISCVGQSTTSPTTPAVPSTNSRVLWGMFQERYPSDYQGIAQATTQLSHPTQVVHSYYSWRDNPNDPGSASVGSFVNQTHKRGQIPLVTWEAWGTTDAQVASGADDAKIDAMAKALAAQKGEVWLRIFHEFNDKYNASAQDGYPWGVAGGTQNTPDQLVAGWRHVHDRFRSDGATNVKFVWTPDGVNMADSALLRASYPGDAYVDYTGWDTYDGYPNQSAYQALTQIAPHKQAVIAEIGATNADVPWLTSLGDAINGGQMPLVRAVVWFDQGQWSLHSNLAVEAALRTMLAGPAFRPSS